MIVFVVVVRGKGKSQVFLKKSSENLRIFILFVLSYFWVKSFRVGEKSGIFPFVPVNLVLWFCNELGPSSAPVRVIGESLIAFVAC